MKISNLVIASTLATFVSQGVGHAQEPKKPKRPERLSVDPEVRKKFEDQANRPQVVETLPVVEWETAADVRTQRISVKLVSMADQSVLVAVPITPTQKTELAPIAKTVTRIDEVDHRTIFGDDLYLRYPVALDFELNRLESKLGQVVEIEVGHTKDRRPLVIFVRGS